ncbi:hypothetical protein DL764_003877 [Monosporascus ibericus]|uniref:Fungal N-terminal domain-containing protein n=1 Tax=Monosporascus ibericus TaxID=155417 RepID=A0A4Q4TGN2_9PEZI|nr:hypothetical protein DL764_003877 [Monosporascus ibericus]
MSGLEIFGATLAAVQAALQVIRAIHGVISDAKEIRTSLEEHQRQLDMTTIIIRSARAEPAIQQHRGAMDATEEIGTIALAVQKHLTSMSGNGRFTEIAGQLVKGRQRKEILGRLMSQLSDRKDDLTAFIGIVNVELAQKLTKQLEQLTIQPRGAPSLEGSRFRSRVITNNKAGGRGVMLNGPVIRGDEQLDKEDNWKDIDHVLIDGNEVKDSGFMVNYANTIDNLKAVANDVLSKVRGEVEGEGFQD